MDKLIDTSVVIRTKNEEKWIGLILEKLLNGLNGIPEIILVDNNSTDSTLEIASKYPIEIISINEFLTGVALNMGIAKTTRPFVAIISGHCIPVSDSWLMELKKAFEYDSKIVGVYGRQVPTKTTPANDVRDLLTIFGPEVRIQSKDPFFHNANSMIKKSAWESLNFSNIATNIEDRIWAKEMQSRGFLICYTPNGEVFHPHGINHNGNPERAKRVVSQLQNYKIYGIPMEDFDVQ